MYFQIIKYIYLKLFQLQKKNEHNFDDIFPIQKKIKNMTYVYQIIRKNSNKYMEVIINIIKLNNNFPFMFLFTQN